MVVIKMKVKVVNASSKKTRNLIKSTFARMVNEKHVLNKITVTELVKRADITRAAFYTHYDNIYDVAKDFQDEIEDIIFNESYQVTTIDEANEYLDLVINHLENNKELYKMILSSDEPLLFMNRINKMLTKHIKEFLKNDSLNLNVIFFVDGVVNLFIKYFKDELNCNVSTLSNFVKDMLKKIILEKN